MSAATLRIEITQDDVDRANSIPTERGSAVRFCPLGCALRRTTGKLDIGVGFKFANVGARSYRLPATLERRLREWARTDTQMAFRPGVFTLREVQP